MAEKQYADKEFLTQYSSYLKEHALDPIAQAIDFDGTHPDAALHLLPYFDEPYFVMTSADNTKSIQLMTNGAWGGNDADGTGMGIRFFSSDGQNTEQGYGNIALKAEPTHGWDYVLTLPNETGTLATRNYVDDQLSDKANASHKHSTSDITSGTLIISRGGTGKSSFTANRVVTTGTTTTGALQASAITTTELGYLDGVTSSIQTQLNGKAATSHTHSASDITSGTLSSARLPEISARSKVSGIIVTNATEYTATVKNPVYFMVGDLGTYFCIMAGRTHFNSGSSPRTATITLPMGVKHLYAAVINEGTGGGSSGTQYYNLFKVGDTSGYGPGGDFVKSFSIQIGVTEACYVNWMVLGDAR